MNIYIQHASCIVSFPGPLLPLRRKKHLEEGLVKCVTDALKDLTNMGELNCTVEISNDVMHT